MEKLYGEDLSIKSILNIYFNNIDNILKNTINLPTSAKLINITFIFND